MKHVKISMLRQVFAARSKFIKKLQLRLTCDVLGGRTGNRQPTAHRRMRCCLNWLSVQGFVNHPVHPREARSLRFRGAIFLVFPVNIILCRVQYTATGEKRLDVTLIHGRQQQRNANVTLYVRVKFSVFGARYVHITPVFKESDYC